MAPTVMCCCVFGIRRGCELIGAVLTAVYSVASVALGGTALYYYLYDYDHLGYRRIPDRLPSPVRHRRPVVLTVLAALTLLYLVFHVLLLVGARQDRPRLLLAWLVFSALAFSAQMAGLVMGFVTATAVHDWGLLAGTVALSLLQALLWHWFLVVRAQYLHLRLSMPAQRGEDQPDSATEVREVREGEEGWRSAELREQPNGARWRR